jgi:hypothetical protein
LIFEGRAWIATDAGLGGKPQNYRVLWTDVDCYGCYLAEGMRFELTIEVDPL